MNHCGPGVVRVRDDLVSWALLEVDNDGPDVARVPHPCRVQVKRVQLVKKSDGSSFIWNSRLWWWGRGSVLAYFYCGSGFNSWQRLNFFLSSHRFSSFCDAYHGHRAFSVSVFPEQFAKLTNDPSFNSSSSLFLCVKVVQSLSLPLSSAPLPVGAMLSVQNHCFGGGKKILVKA